MANVYFPRRVHRALAAVGRWCPPPTRKWSPNPRGDGVWEAAGSG